MPQARAARWTIAMGALTLSCRPAAPAPGAAPVPAPSPGSALEIHVAYPREGGRQRQDDGWLIVADTSAPLPGESPKPGRRVAKN